MLHLQGHFTTIPYEILRYPLQPCEAQPYIVKEPPQKPVWKISSILSQSQPLNSVLLISTSTDDNMKKAPRRNIPLLRWINDPCAQFSPLGASAGIENRKNLIGIKRVHDKVVFSLDQAIV